MITIDINFVIDEIIGPNGISQNKIKSYQNRISEIHKRFNKSEVGFLELLDQDINSIKKSLSPLKDEYQNIVVLGIGGSALGTKAIYQGCTKSFKDDSKKSLYVIDNIDPDYFWEFLENLDIHSSIFIVVSKSGSTAETISQFLIILNLLKKKFNNEYKNRLIIITDPEKGGLRKFAEIENILSFSVPPNVGGRYSVLSPVGLVPLYFVEINIDELILGAKYIYEKCKNDNVFENPAYLIGTIQYIAYHKGKKITVLMPYSSKLQLFTEWFIQLWAESLGKNEKIGPTPIKAIGTTDQHSQLQLFMDGPDDKIITFIEIENYKYCVKIPECNIPEYRYLYNKSLNQLIKSELNSVRASLAKKGRLNYTIKIDKLDEFHLGALIFLLQLTTAFTGFLFNINPFNQPGVEEEKNFTYGMMGRSGYERKYKEYLNIASKTKEKYIKTF